jgi:RNA polymerase sigma-70 factor, ECF subfamily
MKSQPVSAEARQREFAELYERHSREVWALAYSRWLDADMAMDIAQEAFTRLWKHWENGGDEIQNYRAWLLRVARNLAEDYAKSAFKRYGTTPTTAMNGISGRDDQPLDQILRSEVFGQIRAIMDELPLADRDILTMRYALDYDATSIGDLLGTNATAVHMRLSRARQRMAELLEARGITGMPGQ